MKKKIFSLLLCLIASPSFADWKEIYKGSSKDNIQAIYINDAVIIEKFNKFDEKTLRDTEVKILFKLKDFKNPNALSYVQGMYQCYCPALQNRWVRFSEYNKDGKILDHVDNSKSIDMGKIEMIGDTPVNIPDLQEAITVPLESAEIGSTFRFITETVCNLQPTFK